MLEHDSKVIIVFAYRRRLGLSRVVASICEATGQENYKKLLVIQSGCVEVEDWVRSDPSAEVFDHIIWTSPEGNTPAKKISRNRFLGYQFAFDSMSAKWVVALEDDVEVSQDFLQFTNYIISKFSKVKQFMGINFGSIEKPCIDFRSNFFSKQRFGILGPGSMITSETWRKIKWKLVDSSNHFDGRIEFLLKRGFFIFPHRSRYKDYGLDGSHIGKESIEYFEKNAESFSKSGNYQAVYFEEYRRLSWRQDMIPFKRVHNPIFQILSFFFEIHKKDNLPKNLTNKAFRASYRLLFMPLMKRYRMPS